MLWSKIDKKTTGHKKNTEEKQKQVLTGDKKKILGIKDNILGWKYKKIIK